MRHLTRLGRHQGDDDQGQRPRPRDARAARARRPQPPGGLVVEAPASRWRRSLDRRHAERKRARSQGPDQRPVARATRPAGPARPPRRASRGGGVAERCCSGGGSGWRLWASRWRPRVAAASVVVAAGGGGQKGVHGGQSHGRTRRTAKKRKSVADGRDALAKSLPQLVSVALFFPTLPAPRELLGARRGMIKGGSRFSRCLTSGGTPDGRIVHPFQLGLRQRLRRPRPRHVSTTAWVLGEICRVPAPAPRHLRGRGPCPCAW